MCCLYTWVYMVSRSIKGRVRYSPVTKWTGSSEATDLDQISPERLALDLLDNATKVR